MNSQDLRNKFLNFFQKNGHKIIPSASLVPENDPTVLFTTAGMHPLVPFLLGEPHPLGTRLASVQKCIRTDDIDEVGDNCHHTFFEMLGNWSLGDYWKKEAICWSYEFLTKELNIDISRFAVSCFIGDQDAPKDDESAKIWLSLGIPQNKIAFLPKKDNWWGPAGQTGPCGPDTEMFFWTGKLPAPDNFQETHDDPSWVELWNDVFMQYNKQDEGRFVALKQKNVDTGMGLERTLAVLNGFDDNYRTELFTPIIEKIEELSGKKYTGNEKEFRIISDHIKAAVFAVNDGALPSNKAAGYIIRRLIRRAIVQANALEISENFTGKLAKIVFEIYKDTYKFAEDKIITELEKEETKFRKTLKAGLKLLTSKTELYGEDLFNLYQSYGLPIEIACEEARKQNILIKDDAVNQFKSLYEKHQELSRTASAGMFKGGLADAGEQTKRLHTAAHLMLAALRQVLGNHVLQKGSNITPERLRFDFSHPEKMTAEQIKQVEDLVNEQIKKNLPVDLKEMSLEDAKACGAMGVFESKYGEKVKVYSIGSFSNEICGGPHAARTGELGHFKIIKEESSSAGVRRIKAILE